MMNENIIICCKKSESPNITQDAQADVYEYAGETLMLLGKCFDKTYRRISAQDFFQLIQDNNRIIPDICTFNGIFSVIYINRDNEIVFCNDRTNLSRLYYYMSEDLFCLSNRVENIVKSINRKVNIDFTAWSEFVSFYYVLGNKTFFEEIKSLYFRQVLSMNTKSWRLDSHIDETIAQIKTDPSLNYDDAVKKCAFLIQKSVKEIVENTKNIKKLVPLSGGWDSRTIAAASCNVAKNEIETLTTSIDSGHDQEEKYAKLVADYLGIPNTFIDLDRDYFVRELSSNYLRDTEFFSTMHIPFWNFYKKYALNNHIILDGIYGDLFFRGMALPKTREVCGSRAYFDACFAKLKVAKLEKYMPRAIKNGVPYLAQKSMKAEIEKCKYNLKFFIMSNRLKSIGITCAKQNEDNTVLLPFANEELIQYAMSLPEEFIFDKNFYPDIMERLCEGISKIPSTNTKNETASFSFKEVYRLSDTVKDYFCDKLNRHVSDAHSFYDPTLLHRLFEYNPKDITLKVYKDLDLILFYQLWVDHYKEVLIPQDAIHYIEGQTDLKEISRDNELTIVYRNDERQKEMKRWLEFYQSNKKNQHKISVLCTMDVEAFKPEDVRSAHKAKENYIDKLIRANCSGNIGRVLDKIVDLNEVPFTFFTEIYSDAYQNENEYKDILKLCASNGNEAGLHCHPFSLSKRVLEEIGIDFWEYTTPEGFEKIIKYGVDKFRAVIGETPYAYRAGSFEIHNKHFEVLAKQGVRIDSSFYHDSHFNFSEAGKNFKNASGYIDGVYEIPLTTYNQVKANIIRKFDLNTTSFSDKLELIVRSILNHTDYLMMLCHSWSFLKYDQYASTNNMYHTDFSQNTYDELMYMVDFLHKIEASEFLTCKQFLMKQEKKQSLVDIVGTTADIPVCTLPLQYGALRCKTDISKFVNLSEGRIVQNNQYQEANQQSDLVELNLGNEKVPEKFDKAIYELDIPCFGEEEVNLEFILGKHYYNPKIRERNSIRMSILVNNELKFYDFITNPSFNDYMYVSAKPQQNNLNFKLEIECLADEKPWGWDKASKIILKNLYLEREVNSKNNRFLLLRSLNGMITSLNENIKLEDFANGFKIKYEKVNDRNDYLQLFDNSFTVGPSEKFKKYAKILDKKYAVINFKAISQQEDSVAHVFFMTYNDIEGKRVSSESQKVILKTQETFYSKQFELENISRVFKIAIKLDGKENTNEIIVQDLEIVFY